MGLGPLTEIPLAEKVQQTGTRTEGVGVRIDVVSEGLTTTIPSSSNGSTYPGRDSSMMSSMIGNRMRWGNASWFSAIGQK